MARDFVHGTMFCWARLALPTFILREKPRGQQTATEKKIEKATVDSGPVGHNLVVPLYF